MSRVEKPRQQLDQRGLSAARAASKGLPIGSTELGDALHQVRSHALVLDGSAVAETAYWIRDRYGMHRYNTAHDAPLGEPETPVPPRLAVRMDHQLADRPLLGAEEARNPRRRS
ncbi:hypothetical protein ACIHCQ_16845 [Streptomyces sp. NPDC052236]|uniref:hypothetical protein n=1 Tax=Streptomyces sp. NPDC052236 TaxID=3365686 RepID=UPI0037D485E0